MRARSRAKLSGLIALLTLAILSAIGISPAHADHSRPWHWNKDSPTSTAVAQAYFVDNSGVNWPVYGAVLKWDARPNYYRPYYRNPGTCDGSTLHCIQVNSGNYGNTNWLGLTSWVQGTNNHILHGSMDVKFNTYYSLTANQRESTVCHELGHAAGPLKEGNATNSCMYDGAQFPLNPSTHDFDIIVDRYGHNH